MSVINANPLMLGDAGYNIGRSLRFRSSASAYLSRTPASASNRTTWTWSGWVKRGALGTTTGMAYQQLFGACPASGSDATFTELVLNGNDTLQVGGWTTTWKVTTQVFRDTSAWYHFVWVLDTGNATAADRMRLYVNGSRITSFSTSNDPSLNATLGVNNNVAHALGSEQPYSSRYFDGYLAEVNFIDGQALTPSSFGQTDAVTGVWVPKKYTGTYGTNGFYLPFSDNTSATTLAYDKSGNGNNWTPNNISTTAGATYDSMTDVPTLTSATAANYCVLNAVDKLNTIIDGNLTANSASGYSSARGTFGISSGKWYWEQTVSVTTLNAGLCQVGGGISLSSYGLGSGNGNAGMWGFQNSNGAGSASWKFDNGTGTNSYTVFNTGDIAGFALDMSAGTLDVYRNGSLLFTSSSSISGNTVFPYASVYASGQTANSYLNFGQRPFSYTPPTGFKALNTFNLPDPTIKKPNQYMDATTYTGNGTSLTVTNSGSMQPDLVWIKCRSNAFSHDLFDSIRGPLIHLSSDTTNAEYTEPSGKTLTAFNSNGFALGSDNAAYGSTNGNGWTYVGWQWKKGATPGFDIVTYTGNGSGNITVNHSLGVTPAMWIFKNRTLGTTDWLIGHKSLPSNYYLLFNTNAQSNASTPFVSQSSTSMVLSGSQNLAQNYVAYLFAEIAGFSKFGSYTGNGSADGPFVYCGFRPKFILFRNATDTTGDNWNIFDTSRSTYNLASSTLYPNSSAAETTYNALDILSNGFKVRLSGVEVNGNGNTIIFAAFAENPFKYSLAR